jgi:hypothetical protein
MQIRLNAQHQKHLVSRGLPRDLLRARPFDLDGHVVTFHSQVEGLKAKKTLKLTQLDNFNATLEKPFGRPYIYVIASQPNDGKAKQVAAYLMEQATKGQLANRFPRSTRGRQTPLWHTIYGNWADTLRDGRDEQPSMLVLSNITVNSTNTKIEKLRDILEMYNHIPRVVVITGEDPLTFANTKLMMPVTYTMNIATARKVSL